MRLYVLIFSVLFVVANEAGQAQELMIRRGDNSWRKLIETPAQRAEVRTVIVKGTFSKYRAKKLIRTLSDFPSLTELRITGHEFTHIPEELNSCMSLQTLAVSSYSGLDVDSLLALCATLPQLNEVYIGLESMADYPEVPAGLRTLDTLVFFGPEILIGHAGYTLTSTPDSYMKSRYDEDFSEGLWSVDVLPVVCLFPREELDVTPSWTFQPTSATLAGIGLYAGHHKAAPSVLFNESLRKYDHVLPPAVDWITPHEAATINPVSVNVIDMNASNTRIIIPENAFVHSDGSAVTEPVTIYYKEYLDPLDFVLSGIPMSFPQDSSMTYFSSAGMFDIQGFSDGKEVFIDEGKTIEVSLASTTDADGFNFWRFDDSTGQWQDLGANSADEGEETTEVQLTNAQLRYAQLYKTITRYSDPTPLQERFESTSYTYIRRERKEKTHRLAVPRGTVKIDRMVRLRKVQVTGEDKDVVFDISSYPAYHPEMAAFRNCRWHLQDGMKSQEFRKAFAGCNKYSDVRLVNHGEYVEIRLKKGDDIVSVNAIPVSVKGKNREVELSSEMKRYSVYSNRLAKREKHFNKRALKNQNVHDRMPVNDPKWKAELCYARVKRFMKPEEKRLSMDEWLDTYYANRAKLAKFALSASATESGITRMLSLTGFGIYNVDVLRDMSDPVIVRAEYTLADKPVDVTAAYAISLANNSMIAFNGNYGYSAQRLKLEPILTDYLLAIHPDQSISVVTKEELERKLPEQNGKACFQIQHFDKKEHTLGDVKSALGIR
jgi:hypothetical protein